MNYTHYTLPCDFSGLPRDYAARNNAVQVRIFKQEQHLPNQLITSHPATYRENFYFKEMITQQ